VTSDAGRANELLQALVGNYLSQLGVGIGQLQLHFSEGPCLSYGGVIHRDIKPGNVLRSGSHAVVTDFGVAKAISVSMPVSGVTATSTTRRGPTAARPCLGRVHA